MAKKENEKENEKDKQQEIKNMIELLSTAVVYDEIGKLMPRLIGNYHDLKPIGERMEQELRAFAAMDLLDGLTGEAFDDNIIDKFMKELKDEHATTHLYLYCNWRAWATYEGNVEKAKKYQDVCDKIDDYVFDNWSKDKLDYFIKETD